MIMKRSPFQGKGSTGLAPTCSCILLIAAEVREDPLAHSCQEPSRHIAALKWDPIYGSCHCTATRELSGITGWQPFVGVLYKN